MKRIVLGALILFSIVAGAQQVKPSLADVHKLWVPIETPAKADPADWPPAVIEFQRHLFSELAVSKKGSDKKQHLVGDCANGYETVIKGVRLVCHAKDADAALVSAIRETGTHGHFHGSAERDTIGGLEVTGRTDIHTNHSGEVLLFDVKSGENLWLASKSDVDYVMEFFNTAGATGAGEISRKIVKQLKKDWPKTAASH